MRSTPTIRFRMVFLAVVVLLGLVAAKPAAETVWNRPGMLVVRSQLQLMRGNTEGAVDLATQAGAAICDYRAIAAAQF